MVQYWSIWTDWPAQNVMKSIQQTSMEIVPRSSIDLCSGDAKVIEKTKPTCHHKHPTHWIKRVFRTPRKSSAFMYVFKMNDLWIVQPLKKTLPCKFNQTHLETANPTITTNQLNRDLPSQVTGVLQSNAGSSSSMGFFSLAYQRFIRTNLQIPEIFPFPFRISGVLRSLWCHYFTPPKKKKQVNNPLNFANSFNHLIHPNKDMMIMWNFLSQMVGVGACWLMPLLAGVRSILVASRSCSKVWPAM